MGALQVLSLGAGVLAAVSAAYFHRQWRRDNARLRAFAADLLAGRRIDGAAVERLMDKIYHHQGFTQNDGHYLWRRLGATPVQIMDKGGDCSDKSRLTAAVLGEYGIRSTLVMLAPYAGGPFGHTVVEARAADGPIVVDPVYNLTFPSPAGGYYGLRQIRDDPSILPSRLDDLVKLRGADDRIARYRRDADGAHYRHPKTVNLERNGLTRFAKGVLARVVDEPELIPRPRFLEDPKLFLTLAAAGAAVALFAFAGLLALL